jgi:glycosyltransferase involved in cell wall biosynthesis
VNVLYISHTGQLGGAERSLLDLIGALPDEIRPMVATPAGSLQRELQALGVPTATITGTASSLRLHPLHTLRGAREIAASARQIKRAAAAHRADVAHANSIRAGAMLALAPLAGVAKVAHVRDCLPPGAVTSATMRLIASGVELVVANSRYTARWVSTAAPRARVRVVYNGVDIERFSPRAGEREAARAALGARSSLLVGVVAQLTPWKGQDTAIETLRLVRAQGVDARLLLIGSAKFRDPATRFDNERYVARLRALARDLGLQPHVGFLGEREDVPQLMSALDVLLAPSWEEPFGRSVVEAMAMGVAVVATDVGGPVELLDDGAAGVLVAPRRPQAWAEAVGRLVADPELVRSLADAARARVLRCFTVDQHAARMVDVYEQVAGRPSSAREATASRA